MLKSNYVTPVLNPDADVDDEVGLSVADLAWAAGFFDGEGCIVGSRGRTGGAYYFTLMVSVGQVDPRPLEHLRGLFGGTVQPHRVKTAKVQASSVWTVTGGYARNFLNAVEPYLRVKGERARLALRVSPEALYEQPNRPGTLNRRIEATA